MRLSFTGDCTVTRAEEIRASILEALDSGEGIEIDLEGVTAIDLTFCQILHALRQSCAAKGVELKLPDKLPEALASQALFCGLPEMAGENAKREGKETERTR